MNAIFDKALVVLLGILNYFIPPPPPPRLVESPYSQTELLHRLIAIFPDFAETWKSSENMCISEDGSFTFCGVFTRLQEHFREKFDQFTPTQLDAFASLLEGAMKTADTELHVTAATCFLEDIADAPFIRDFHSRLRGSPREFLSNLGVGE